MADAPKVRQMDFARVLWQYAHFSLGRKLTVITAMSSLK